MEQQTQTPPAGQTTVIDEHAAVDARIKKEKEAILETLKTVPFVTSAVKKIGRDRSTFYRWMNEDSEFASKVDEAQWEGNEYLYERATTVLAKHATDGTSWRASLAYIQHHDRRREDPKQKISPEVINVLTSPEAIQTLTTLAAFVQSMTEKEETPQGNT